MIIKVIGVFLLVFCTTLVGVGLSKGFKNRLRDITWYSTALECISGRIAYTNQELGGILSALAGSDNYYEIEAPFKVTLKKTCLKKEDEELILEYFSNAGMSDSESERRRCKYYQKELETIRQRLQNETAEKSKLYRLLGFFTGLAVAIIII